MNPQELCLVLKGVALAKESLQIVCLSSSTHDKHKLAALTDHLYKHLIADGNSRNEYHSMLTLDTRKSQKDKSYFMNIIAQDDQNVDAYIQYIKELGKSGPCNLIISGFECFLKYLAPKQLLKFLEAIQSMQTDNLSRLV